jgi:hypothetical protein
VHGEHRSTRLHEIEAPSMKTDAIKKDWNTSELAIELRERLLEHRARER